MGSEWRPYKIDDLIIKRNQGVNTTTEKVKYSEAGMTVIRANNISGEGIDWSNCVYVDTETFAKIKSPCKPKKGDILYTNIGSQFGVAVKVERDEEFVIAWNVLRIKTSDLVDADFLVYLLNNPRNRNYIQSLNSSSTMPFVSGKVVGELKFFFPKPREQFQIKSLLRPLDKKIELNRQTNQTLEQMAQALFKSWFVDFDPVIDNALAAGNAIPDELQERAQRRQQQLAKPDHKPLPDDILQLFPSEFGLTEGLGWVPKGWEVKPLDKIAHYQNGLALQKFRPTDEDLFLPVLKISHLKQGFTDGKEKASPDIRPSCIVDDGDIVFSWSGSLMIDIWCGGKAALNQHLFKVTSEDYPRWFYYYFTMHHLIEFQRIAADKAVTMGHIKREHLSQAKCAVPPPSLIDAAGGNIETINDKQILLRQNSNELSKLRDTLLPKLISGELRLPSEVLPD